jgi:predicted flap endonuclease-1-like 5' DNA nuclease
MWYLITQYWFWLLLAFIIGLIIGWMTWGGTRRGWGWLPLGALVAAVLFLLSWFRIINGLPALWIESGILLFTSYIAGCWLGGVFKGQMAPEIAVPMAAAAMATPKPAAPKPDAPAPVMAAVPAPAPAPVVATPKPEPVAVAPAAMPKVEGEDLHAGKRPPGLMAPRGGKADDLKWIRGIGKQNEGRLHGLGIWHFDQIASWTKEHVEWVGSYLAFVGRIDREEWIKQAKALASGKETEFAKRVKWGQVATSKDDGSLGQGNVEKLSADKRPENAGKGAIKPASNPKK